MTMDRVFFVTRLKANATFEVVEQREVPSQGNVVKDEIIRFTGYRSQQDYPGELRRVCIFDEKRLKVLQFLTNNMKLSASTIAAIYKERWQIEIFFKTIKQYLKIKTFLGTTVNAVMTQIWTALITMLLLQYLRWKSSMNWSLSNLLAMLRLNLFVHRNLFEWLDNPFTPVPEPPETEKQLVLSFNI